RARASVAREQQQKADRRGGRHATGSAHRRPSGSSSRASSRETIERSTRARDGAHALHETARLRLDRDGPFACARLGPRMANDIRDDGRAIRAGRERRACPLRRQPADRDERGAADETLRFRDPLEPSLRPRHRRRLGREDRTERDVVGLQAERPLELGAIARVDAEPDLRAADRSEIGPVEIALPEMDEIAAFVDRDAPVIDDDEHRAVTSADLDGRTDLGADVLVGAVFDSDLDQPRAAWNQTLDPERAVDDRAKARQDSRHFLRQYELDQVRRVVTPRPVGAPMTSQPRAGAPLASAEIGRASCRERGWVWVAR